MPSQALRPLYFVLTLPLFAIACAPEPEPPLVTPPAAPQGPTVVVTEAVARLRPSQGTFVIEPIAKAPRSARKIPGLEAQAIEDLPIVEDGVAESGPPNSVELVTNSFGYDTDCPAGYQSNTFCGNITLRHFYDLVLSDVFVQVTAVTDLNDNPLPDHGGINNDPAARDLDNSLGLWQYTSPSAPWAGILGRSPDNAGSRDWVFANPDNADTNIYLRVVASLYPTLWFNADWSIDQSAPLVAGEPAIVHYDPARLSTCRGADWTLNAFFVGPTTHQHQLSHPGTPGVDPFDLHFSVPFGSDLQFWFNNTDSGGCSAWDSDYGNNFHFTPQNPTPTIHFLPNWTTQVTGTLHAGAPITIDYDLNRLPNCGQIDAYDRLSATTSAVMFYRFDGGAVEQVSLTEPRPFVPTAIDGQAGQLQAAPTITAPPGASQLAVWFQSTDPVVPVASCVNWDSNYGANYSFALVP